MDEVAFVESLFAPEMRSAITVSSNRFASPFPSCGRMVDRTPPSSSTSFGGVPPPPNSLLGGGIALAQGQTPFQPLKADEAPPPLFVRLNEDELFSQMLVHEHDFTDLQQHGHPMPTQVYLKQESERCRKPFTRNTTTSLLLEPLDLPRGIEEEDEEEPCLPDTIDADSATTFQQSFRPCGALKRGGTTVASNNSFHYGYNLDGILNLMPLGSQTPVYFGTGDFATVSPPPSYPWMHEDEEQVHFATTPGNSINLQRVQTMKHMINLTGVGMMPQQPSPGAVDMLNAIATSSEPYASSPELWISTSRNTLLDVSLSGECRVIKQSLDVIKTPVACPPFSLTISPPASLTDKALKELIVSTDFGTPTASRPKRPRTLKSDDETDYVVSPGRQRRNTTSAAGKSTKGKKCVEVGCTRRAQSNSRCKAHGGGARCQYAVPGGCTRSSQGGGFCRAHGGGKRCEFPECTRGQQRKGRCYVHGGIRKCQYGTCEKKDRGNGFCIAHGGGKRCEHPNCSRAVRRGLRCQIHETQPAAEKELEEMVSL